jgi:hypothetical protein
MKASTLFIRLALLLVASTAFAAPAAALIIVYDNDLDFSNTNNPAGTWSYLQGNSLLSQQAAVPNPQLALAVPNGYWGASSSSINSSMMLPTANGSVTGLWSDSDFLAGDMLLRTTDPNTGGPMILAWTAPSAGSFTYAGEIWFADAPSGPSFSDFTLSLNANPPTESGTVGFGQNRTNGVNLANGSLPIAVNAGDVFALEVGPAAFGPPTGALLGVLITIDFTPVPEPGSCVLSIMGLSAIFGLTCRQAVRGRSRQSRSPR